MSKFNHTGRISPIDSRQNIDVIGEDGRIIVGHADPNREREIAALVVAAPEMLATLKEINAALRKIDSFPEFFRKTGHAIAKAEGKA